MDTKKKIIIIGCGSEGLLEEALNKTTRLTAEIGAGVGSPTFHIVEPDINMDELKALAMEFQAKDFQVAVVSDGLTNLVVPEHRPFAPELEGLPKICEQILKDCQHRLNDYQDKIYLDEHTYDTNPYTRSGGGRKNKKNKKNYRK